MKKRILSLFALILTVLILAACAAPSDGTTISTPTPETAVTVNGVSLDEYAIVYEADSVYARFAAENLRDYILRNLGVVLEAYPDTARITPYEILVGNTARVPVAEEADALDEEEYIVRADGTKILLIADGYMVGGAARGLLDLIEGGKGADGTYAATVTASAEAKTYEYKDPKSVILFIGDGMGRKHIEWALFDSMSQYYADDMPNQGFVQTYSYSVRPLWEAYFTDSAAAGTALATGYKTRNKFIGINPEGEPLKNIRELAHESGAKTAVLTTDNYTGATPSAFLAHCESRNDTYELKKQIDAVVKNGEVDVYRSMLGDGLLAMSQNTLNSLAAGNGPFFMMLEESEIDEYSHDNDSEGMIRVLKRFNEVIANAMQFTLIQGDVVFVVTSDHETGGVTYYLERDKYMFTSTDHTDFSVRVCAMGKGADVFNVEKIENVLIPQHLAKIFGDDSFGDLSFRK